MTNTPAVAFAEPTDTGSPGSSSDSSSSSSDSSSSSSGSSSSTSSTGQSNREHDGYDEGGESGNRFEAGHTSQYARAGYSLRRNHRNRLLRKRPS